MSSFACTVRALIRQVFFFGLFICWRTLSYVPVEKRKVKTVLFLFNNETQEIMVLIWWI